MRKFISVILMSLTFSALADNLEGTIKNQTEEILFAFMLGDIDTYKNFIYPKVIELSGGEKNLVLSIKNELSQQKKEGMKLISYNVISVSKPIRAGSEMHSIVEYSITMSTKNGNASAQTYFVAVSDHSGQKWTFVDGSLLSTLKANQIFPDYNPNLRLPTEVDTSKTLSKKTQYVDIDTYLAFPVEVRGVYAAGMTDAFIYLSKKTGYLSGLEECLNDNEASAKIISNLLEEAIKNWKKAKPGKDIEISLLFATANRVACADFIK